MEAFPYYTDGGRTGRGAAAGVAVGLATQTQVTWLGGITVKDLMAAVLATAAGSVLGAKIRKSDELGKPRTHSCTAGKR